MHSDFCLLLSDALMPQQSEKRHHHRSQYNGEIHEIKKHVNALMRMGNERHKVTN